MNFPTSLPEIEARIHNLSIEAYGKTRNYKNGAISYLSPYISRGVISTKQLFAHALNQDLKWWEKEKFVQELVWRDYWQQVWIAKGDLINKDLKQPQSKVNNHLIPKSIIDGNTGIEAVDEAIETLKKTGYMHNHMRMYVASMVCNIAQCQWLAPAQWMYGHLLDGDWASNALSWQWVAGANANKKYYANQENINHYFFTSQKNTFLDHGYEVLPDLDIPSALSELVAFDHRIQLPQTGDLTIDNNKKTLIYNYYNIDPNWHKDEDANRVFLIEPAFFEAYPINQKCLEFAVDLTSNVPEIQIHVGGFDSLKEVVDPKQIIYKEHPTNLSYTGTEEPRDWMFELKGYFPSFFNFWKKAKKQIDHIPK
ncbi:FAD-binding domain-containing protein [Roseivirga seohaensis]|uniref:FAD-binding domain-containing protein n=1 Tax=Roseivirga seohaensis TaxID=1914963 RepID=UPI003BA913A3